MLKLSDLFTIIFYPGIIVHELSHLVACWIIRVRVSKVKLFSLKEAYIKHSDARALKMVSITLAPFVMGTIISAFLLIKANGLAQSTITELKPLLYMLLYYYLSFAIVYYSFPSRGDTNNSLDACLKALKGLLFKEENLLLKLLKISLLSWAVFAVMVLLSIMYLIEYSKLLRLAWFAYLLVFFWNPASALL